MHHTTLDQRKGFFFILLVQYILNTLDPTAACDFHIPDFTLQYWVRNCETHGHFSKINSPGRVHKRDIRAGGESTRIIRFTSITILDKPMKRNGFSINRIWPNVQQKGYGSISCHQYSNVSLQYLCQAPLGHGTPRPNSRIPCSRSCQDQNMFHPTAKASISQHLSLQFFIGSLVTSLFYYILADNVCYLTCENTAEYFSVHSLNVNL